MEKIKTLEEIQKINFDMMLYLKKLADQNGIKLMLSGGTLLGAVRHQDFIPWDDDVDLMLMRKDYTRLIKCIESDKTGPYQVMTVHNTRTYQFSYAKLVDTRTCVKEKQFLEIQGMGVSVDIFPIDPLPNDPALRKKFICAISKIAFDSYALRDTNYHEIKQGLTYWSRIFRIRCHIRLIDCLNKLLSLKKADFVAVTMGQYKEREIMRKKDMIHQVRVTFHGEEFLAPIGYQNYLSSLYGRNYMKLPPKSKQKPKHAMSAYWK